MSSVGNFHPNLKSLNEYDLASGKRLGKELHILLAHAEGWFGKT